MTRLMPTLAFVRSAAPAAVLFVLVACGGGGDTDQAAADSANVAPTPLLVADADVAVVDSFRLEAGPTLSGRLTAERSAMLRPQVGGAVLAVRVRAGDRVGAGQVIAVIDTLVLSDQLRSARLGARSAELAATTAQRNVERSTELFQAGAIAERDVETARNQAAQATAILEDARARVASATQMLSHAIVRAPFAGVVSDVPVSVGDVVQAGPGAGGMIATVVDPTSLELEASVPAANLAALKPGARVEFTVSAHPGRVFTGTVARVNPSVDPTTGQVRLYVRVPNPDGTLAAGLFAEGRVALEAAQGLAVPLSALDARATVTSVKRVRGGVVEVVPVTLGLRDDLAQRVQVTNGLARGDTVLAGAAIGVPAGVAVRFNPRDR